MIDPFKITNFNRSKAQLEEFALFGIAVQGHTSYRTAKDLEDFLYNEDPLPDARRRTPFEIVRSFIWSRTLMDRIQKSRLGNHTQNYTAFYALATCGHLDLATVSMEDLLRYPRMGPKTARFFILHSRPGQRLVVLDTHTLKYFVEQGLTHYKSTPPLPKYLPLEAKIADWLEQEKGVTDFAEFDLDKWSFFARRPKETQ